MAVGPYCFTRRPKYILGNYISIPFQDIGKCSSQNSWHSEMNISLLELLVIIVKSKRMCTSREKPCCFSIATKCLN